jgi:hypothetical protein
MRSRLHRKEDAMNDQQHVDRLIRKLETLAALSDEEKQVLRGLPRTTKAFKADQDIVSAKGTVRRSAASSLKAWCSAT